LTTTPAIDFAPAPTEHAWLRDRRAAAAAHFAEHGLPSPEEEDWRHSRIAELDLGRFSPAGHPSPESDAERHASLPVVSAIGQFALLAVTYDGYLVHQEGDAPGITLTDLSTSADSSELDRPGPDVFAALNTAQAPSPLLIEAAPGAMVEKPVVVVHWTGQEATSTFPRTVVRAGKASQLTVVEVWLSDDVEALVVPRTELDADRDAILRHVVLSDLAPRVWQIASTTARSGQGASIVSGSVALGGEYSRFRIDADLVEEGGEAQLVAAYFGDGQQVHDFRTLQDHTGKRTSSDLVFKGAVTGSSRSVYSGLIRVNPGATATSAFLTNRNLVLSDDATAYSVPNLEIINENDLRSCGHAATSGPIDEDQVFYLESRGVPTEVARRLIILGFFDDVLSRFPVEGLRGVARDRVAAKLLTTAGVA
jgi:Fe-S cluster assembly protein SufD